MTHWETSHRMKVWVAYMSSQKMSLLCAGFSTVILRVWLNPLNSRSDHHGMLEMCTTLWEQQKAPLCFLTCVPPWGMAQLSTVPANPCLKPLGLNCRALGGAEGEQLQCSVCQETLSWVSSSKRNSHSIKTRVDCLLDATVLLFLLGKGKPFLPTLNKSLDLWLVKTVFLLISNDG